MVVGNRLSLLGWELTERRPQAIVRGFGDIGRGPGLRDVNNWRRPTALGTENVDRLVVGNSDKPSLVLAPSASSGYARNAARKVSDQASSASGRASTARHTRSTVGPCSATISSNGRFIVINLVDDGTVQNVRFGWDSRLVVNIPRCVGCSRCTWRACHVQREGTGNSLRAADIQPIG